VLAERDDLAGPASRQRAPLGVLDLDGRAPSLRGDVADGRVQEVEQCPADLRRLDRTSGNGEPADIEPGGPEQRVKLGSAGRRVVEKHCCQGCHGCSSVMVVTGCGLTATSDSTGPLRSSMTLRPGSERTVIDGPAAWF
jgi:hypothetical protein